MSINQQHYTCLNGRLGVIVDDMNVMERAIETFGSNNQVLKVAEECAELAVECHHYASGRDNLEALTEEMADVRIMLDQLLLIVGPEGRDAFARQVKEKTDRLAEYVDLLEDES